MKFYIESVKAWAPGIENGLDAIENVKVSPKIEFTDPLFRRRFSQITKMTIQVIHDVVEAAPEARNSKIVFASFRGELEREFAIDRMIIEDKMILPAAFSLSVFNTPVAAATIALGMKGGYTVIYPSQANFHDAVMAAASSVLCGDEEQVLFAYADEKIPDEYEETMANYKCQAELLPLAFACIISSKKNEGSIELDTSDCLATPMDFLKKTLQGNR